MVDSSNEPLEMTEEQLDAELRSFGLDPEQVVQNAFSKLCVVLQQKSRALTDMEKELTSLRISYKAALREIDNLHSKESQMADIHIRNPVEK